MGLCQSSQKLRQGAVHPEFVQHPNETLPLHRPPQHNNHPQPVATKKTTNRRRQPNATPLRPKKVSRIDYTPIAKSEKDRYKYSCPLCFCYFTDTILTTSCCSNYTCYQCALDHSKNHGVAPKAKHLPETMKGVPCPHCNTADVQLKYVTSTDEIRSYDTSPATKLRLEGGSVDEEEQEGSGVGEDATGTPRVEVTPEIDSSSSENGSPGGKNIDATEEEEVRSRFAMA